MSQLLPAQFTSLKFPSPGVRCSGNDRLHPLVVVSSSNFFSAKQFAILNFTSKFMRSWSENRSFKKSELVHQVHVFTVQYPKNIKTWPKEAKTRRPTTWHHFYSIHFFREYYSEEPQRGLYFLGWGTPAGALLSRRDWLVNGYTFFCGRLKKIGTHDRNLEINHHLTPAWNMVRLPSGIIDVILRSCSARTTLNFSQLTHHAKFFLKRSSKGGVKNC